MAKKPIFELRLTYAVPDHEALMEQRNMAFLRECDIADLSPRDIWYSKYRFRRWEGNEAEMTRLMDKWCSKPNTVSAVLYNDKGFMVAQYEKEDKKNDHRSANPF